MKTDRSADVIVIGAGMAGVSAAAALQDRFLDVIVLEARPDRIGGRIWSKPVWGDSHVDLGASWMTHETINPLADIVALADIPTASSELLNFTLGEANGYQLSEDEIAEALALYGDVYAEVKLSAAREQSAGRPDRAASGEFRRVIQERQLSPEQLRRLEFFINYAITEPNASPLEDLSLYSWDDDYIFVQAAMSVFPNGYQKVVEVIAEDLDVRLDHVVSKIDYRTPTVVVSTNHGDFTAPQVVVALPHAVLKAKDAVVFDPPLPTKKREAIERIHTGLSNKFFFRFPEPFWYPNPDRHSADSEPDAVHRIDETMKGEWSTWTNFHKYLHIPVLMCFNRNAHAEALERMSDDEVLREVMPILRARWGDDVPVPRLERSHWGVDPFALGTIPHVPPNADGSDFRLMRQRVGPIGFCGDSTTDEFPGLSMGAHLTGVQAASRVPIWRSRPARGPVGHERSLTSFGGVSGAARRG